MGRFIRRHWFVGNTRTVLEDGAEIALKSRGIPVIDPEEIVNPKPVHHK